VTANVTLSFVLLGGGATPGGRHGTVFGYHVEYTPAVVVHCQYGTELQPSSSFVYYLTPGLIDVWLGEVGMPWAAPLFTALWFTTLNVQTLCGSDPPPFPPIDLFTLESSIETKAQILRAVAWFSVCQCKAGTPTPIPFPPPSQTQPTGWPAVPTFGCDNVDVCAALVQMQQQLTALQAALGQNLGLTTLLQRYGQPFAYIPGVIHSGIHASGSFAVSRLVGMRVTVVQRTNTEKLFSGTPTYITDLGWMSILTGDGMIDETRLTRDSQTWFPKLMPLAISFGLSLREGIVVDVQELEAEP
jgi:hypothetical protein